jgi:hypothetical protein
VSLSNDVYQASASVTSRMNAYDRDLFACVALWMEVPSTLMLATVVAA